jgi:hypothetical protein
MRPLQRIQPILPVKSMQTYRISRPVATHTRPGTCVEVDCPDFVNGWDTILPVGHGMVDALRRAAMQAVDLGDGAKRKCTVTREDAMTVTFRFEAGQPCFKASTHRVPLDRPENYLVRGGDWRGTTGLIRKHNRPEHWVEDMSETLESVERRLT